MSGSRDGSIKIWDGISSKCVGTISQAHEGAPVGSVAFSRSGKYVLSSGMDSSVKLWELSSLRCIIAYTGAGTMGMLCCTASFNAILRLAMMRLRVSTKITQILSQVSKSTAFRHCSTTRKISSCSRMKRPRRYAVGTLERPSANRFFLSVYNNIHVYIENFLYIFCSVYRPQWSSAVHCPCTQYGLLPHLFRWLPRPILVSSQPALILTLAFFYIVKRKSVNTRNSLEYRYIWAPIFYIFYNGQVNLSFEGHLKHITSGESWDRIASFGDFRAFPTKSWDACIIKKYLFQTMRD